MSLKILSPFFFVLNCSLKEWKEEKRVQNCIPWLSILSPFTFTFSILVLDQVSQPFLCHLQEKGRKLKIKIKGRNTQNEWKREMRKGRKGKKCEWNILFLLLSSCALCLTNIKYESFSYLLVFYISSSRTPAAMLPTWRPEEERGVRNLWFEDSRREWHEFSLSKKIFRVKERGGNVWTAFPPKELLECPVIIRDHRSVVTSIDHQLTQQVRWTFTIATSSYSLSSSSFKFLCFHVCCSDLNMRPSQWSVA